MSGGGSSLSTHVLDTSLGRPAAGVAVTLSGADDRRLGSAVTDDDGRVGDLAGAPLDPGTYTLRFDVADYFSGSGRPSFYPSVSIEFVVGPDDEDGSGGHYHVPLLLSPFGYSTYRGS